MSDTATTSKSASTKSYLNEEIQFEGSYSKTLLSTLKWAYRPYQWRMLSIVIIGFISRLLMLGQANIIGHWVDEPDITGSKYLLILILMSTFGLTGTFIYRIFFSRFSSLAVSQIYDETTFRTSRFPIEFFDRTPVGRITTRFSSDYGSVFRLFGGPIAEFVALIFDLLSMIILLTVASPYYILIMLVVFISHYFIYRTQIAKLRELRRETSRYRSPSIAHFSESAQGVSLIRLFLKQRIFLHRFQKLESQYQSIRKLLLIRLSQFAIYMNLTSVFCFFFTGFLAWILIQNQLVSVGSLVVAFGFVVASGNTIQMFFDWMTQMEEAIVGLERMDHFIRMPIESGSKLPSQTKIPTQHWKDTKKSSTMSPLPAASVEFKDVSLKYAPELPWVLENIQFKIEPGEKFGIIGRTGSGKSSLIQCLFYLYPPQKGTVSIQDRVPDLGGYPHKTKPDLMDLKDFRSQMAFISQDPTIFHGRLHENLSFSFYSPTEPKDLHRKISDQELIDTLRQVGLEHLANPESLNMMIEEKGKNLSQGERQLICMARCLLQKAPVVIMDEATSNVDPQSEQILVEATEKFFKEKTVIIIAHRLSTLQNCDRVLWLHQGKIRCIGKPEEVLEQFQAENH